ncbi:response regulator [Aggregatilinea lenta]|uniref:response regulator n=1 Tax=Aggregatilinea lenta TaxID=913108 RepID=UPI000E5AB896|nr:response regulator [Aggregatilinea lenta]
MALQILLVWVITGAVLGALITSILYARKQRNPLPGAVLGGVLGAVGNLIALVPLWLSIVRSDDSRPRTPVDPDMREAVMAAVIPPYGTDSDTDTDLSQPTVTADTACIIVEDDPDIFDTLMALLEIWNIDPIAFTTGGDTIKWIDDLDDDVTVVSVPPIALLDIRLPDGIYGTKVAARMRRSPLLNNIAIVLMTAFVLSPQEERDVMAESQADLLIYKPLPAPNELRQQLRDVMIQRQKESVL